MVLIISNSQDSSTTKVIEWLEHYKCKWFRINKEDIVSIQFDVDDMSFLLDEVKLKLSEIKSVWYRRGFINNHLFKRRNLNPNSHPDDINNFLNHEHEHLKQYIYFLLSKKKSLNLYAQAEVNKLIVTDLASEYGLVVPKSFILDSLDSLLKIKKKLITKTISGNPTVFYEDSLGVLYTTEVSIHESMSDSFSPSLFQELIEKKYELRIFYLDGHFYSMAIFSQNDNQTKIDFRKYNRIKPNRNVPFLLPKEIKEKIKKLMKRINLNCGSIDMIYSKQNQFVFLEVNPIGQFGMVSYPCNYNLEQKVAKFLS
nr:grasp-with-spasm system ATP-grasp peptide maturase [uncultured Allomuricauda sp.]